MKTVYILGSIAVLIAAIVVITANSGGPGEYDEFAKCLADSGFKFYGAYWCPHCQDQKEMFGNSADELPYIECSLPKRAGQTTACIQAGITSYPTWELPSGKRLSGVIGIEELRSLSGCEIDQAQ